MTKALDVLQRIDGAMCRKSVSVACCPFCRSDQELIVSDVERDGYAPAYWPSAVQCGGCGASGPWGDTEESAVKKWNQATGVETVCLSDWTAIPPLDPAANLDEFPF